MFRVPYFEPALLCPLSAIWARAPGVEPAASGRVFDACFGAVRDWVASRS